MKSTERPTTPGDLENKPSPDRFRSMAAAFFNARTSKHEHHRAVAMAEFRSAAAGVLDPTLVNQPLPDKWNDHAAFFEQLERAIVAASESWAYQDILKAVYTDNRRPKGGDS